jgi:three-Cys-motif partner protein
MPESTVWELEPHTRAKHELLRRYLGAWFPIMAFGRNPRVLFLDGFAGPGVYANGEPGSPIIALDTLVTHTHFDKFDGTEFVFLFVETDPDRFASLEEELVQYWEHRGGQPANIKVQTFNDTFEAAAGGVLDAMREQKAQLAPPLAFIDPFGWSGVPLELIADLLSFDKCEVLFNFMYDSVNRFVTDERPGVAKHFAALFGSSEGEHQDAAGLSGDDRKRFLRDLYMARLQEVGGFRFVRSFELMDVERGRTAYYLMFGTRHQRGLAVMKEAMWALDPAGGVRFSGFAGDQEMLFEPEVDVGPLRTAIFERYAGASVRVEEIERFVIEETDFKTTHYKKLVLKVLEQDGLIRCETERKMSNTYPDGTVLRFADGDE